MISPLSLTGTKRARKKSLLNLQEKIVYERVLELMNNKMLNAKARQWVMEALHHGTVDGEFLVLDTEYKFGKKSDSGRLYASHPSLQTAPGALRRFVSQLPPDYCPYVPQTPQDAEFCKIVSGIKNLERLIRIRDSDTLDSNPGRKAFVISAINKVRGMPECIYADIDIQNAFPVILQQIAVKHGVLAPLLLDYVTKRDTWINSICGDNALSFKQVKTAVLISMHNGNYLSATENKKHEKLDAFAAEVKRIAEELQKVPSFRNIWAEAVDLQKYKKFKNPIGTFVSKICQVQECAIIVAVKDYLEQHGYKVGSLVFDGVMAYLHDVLNRPLNNDLLKDAAEYAFKQTGYLITLMQKSMAVTPMDLVYLGIQGDLSHGQADLADMSFNKQHVHLNPEQKLILFGYNGTLGAENGEKLRPGIENLKRLQSAGYAIGIWSNADTKNIPLQRMVSTFNLQFSVVLTGEECEEPTQSYRDEHKLGRWDKLKPVTKRFPNHKQVVIVDDTPAEIPTKDRHLLRPIKTWDGTASDTELTKMVMKLLDEDKKIDFEEEEDSHPDLDKPQTFFEDAKEISFEDMPHRDDNSGKKAMFPIDFPPGVRVLGINAAMGLGKSHTAVDYIKKMLHDNPSARILFISNRRQQAQTFMSFLRALKFEHYRDIAGHLHDVDLLVIQYESLCRLLEYGNLATYDLVVIDEARAVTGQMISHTNGKKFHINANIYHIVLQTASLVLMMDADLEADGMVQGLMESIWTLQQRHVIRYTHAPLKRQIALVDEKTWYASVRRDIRAGHKLMLVFRGKNEMQSWIKTELSKGIEYLAIDGDSTEVELQQIFKDVNAAVRHVQVLCFTSKVTTGADIQEQFYRVYAHCKAFSGPTARELYQMIGRARNVLHTEVVVVLPAPINMDRDFKSKVKFEEDILKEQKRVRRSYSEMASSKLILGEKGKINWSETWLLKLVSHHSAEQYECFSAAFHRHTLRKEYEFVDPDAFVCTDEGPLKAVENSRLLHDKEKKEAAEALHAAMKQKTQGELRSEENELLRVRQEDRTPEQLAMLQLIFVYRHFPHHHNKLNLSQVRWFDKHHKDLKRAKWVQELETAQSIASANCQSQDMLGLLNSSFAEKRPVDLPILSGIQQLLIDIGFAGGITDTTTEIEVTKLRIKNNDILLACKEIVKFTSARFQGHEARGALHCVLKLIGYTLHLSQKGKKKVQWYSIRRLPMTDSLLSWVHFNLEAAQIDPSPFIGITALPAALMNAKTARITADADTSSLVLLPTDDNSIIDSERQYSDVLDEKQDATRNQKKAAPLLELLDPTTDISRQQRKIRKQAGLGKQQIQLTLNCKRKRDN